ncbi:exopolysaccharide biosynthesis protein, partial [Amycolatopsis mediterranei]
TKMRDALKKTGRPIVYSLCEWGENKPWTWGIFEFSPDRPTVPDATASSGVLVVLGAGTRTAWQLVQLAEACTDGGQEIVGAVLTHAVRPGEPEKPGPAAEAPEKALAGSA